MPFKLEKKISISSLSTYLLNLWRHCNCDCDNMNLFKNREAENIFWECDDVSQDKENHPQELFTNTNDSSKPGKESQCFNGHHTLLHQHLLIKLNSYSIVCSSWIWWLSCLFCQISEKLNILWRQVTMLLQHLPVKQIYKFFFISFTSWYCNVEDKILWWKNHQ